MKEIFSPAAGGSALEINAPPLHILWKGGEKMQEEVENRTLTLVVSGTKFTGRLLKAAISKYMAHRKEKKLAKAEKP